MSDKKPKKQNINTFVKATLRSASLRWWSRDAVYKRIRVDRGQYKCEDCGEIFKQKEIQIDHIEPVIDIRLGFTTWDDYIMRLFVEPDKLQGICASCHSRKTMLEDAMREHFNKKRKKQKD
jgi:5-methylcytosine-specific restriction endonuclease McrA